MIVGSAESMAGGSIAIRGIAEPRFRGSVPVHGREMQKIEATYSRLKIVCQMKVR